MANNLTPYGANAILDGTAMPATLYVQLHVGNPGTSGSANIAAEADRVSFTRAAAAGGATSNAGSLLWEAIPANETITHISIHDAAAAGNCWWVGDNADLVVEAGNNIVISAGALDLAFTVWS